MKAAGVLIFLVAVALSSVMADSATPRHASPSRQSARASWEGLAIVVNRNNPIADITLPELRSMFYGERKWWSHKHRITLAAMKRSTAEWKTVQRVIYKVDQHQLEHYYLYQSFKGEGVNLPVAMPAPADVKKFVANTPGALGYVRASDVDDSVKVVRINGLLPADDGYPLRLRARPATK
jgi:ABC-type phosphate transport system substrate-binding protein